MPKLRDNDTITERIYPRKRGDAAPRYYGDFRDHADVGGGQEPLSPEGGRYATTCPNEAKSLATARLEALRQKRAARPKGPAAKRRLEVLIPYHLERKAQEDFRSVCTTQDFVPLRAVGADGSATRRLLAEGIREYRASRGSRGFPYTPSARD